MKKVTFLAGAAALALPYGANAADAVVIPDPEPMEYVRVCDAYGVGFFYIPGTETCLRIGGYLRYDLGVGNPVGSDIDGDGEADTYFNRSRFALRTDVRSQTELGELKTYAQINFDFDTEGSFWTYAVNPGKHQLYINHAYVELGGFRVGVTDSAFSAITDFAGNVTNDWLLGYGRFQTNQIAYTYTGSNGFSATVAAEQGVGDFEIQGYVPHLVAGASLTQGWGKVSAVAGYDSLNEVWAGKARLDVNVSDTVVLWVMGGYKTVRADNSTNWGTDNYYGNWGGDWALWTGGSWRFKDNASFNAQFAYDEAQDLLAVANIEYEIVKDFRVIPEILYSENLVVDGDKSVAGFLRFQRTF